MSERAKSAVLLMLVVLSIFLTYQLWFGRKQADTVIENDYETVYFEETRPLSQLLIPERIFIYQADLCYQVRPDDPDFNMFWEELSEMLKEITEPANFEYGESLPEGAKLCLALQFNPTLPLGRESPWLKNASGGELSGMQIWRLADRCWGILQEVESPAGLLLLPARRGSQLAALCDQFDPGGRPPYEQLEAGELQVSQGVTVSINAPIYVPVHNQALKELVLKAEVLDHELLLKTFFINRNLVREIKERDGGLIYTDGEQGLRLGDGLDYSHPRLEQKPVALSSTAALLTAGKLLGYYGGWPENLRLENLAREAGAKARPTGIYNAQWRSYFKGYPLLGEMNVVMSYHHGGLVSYRRSIFDLLYSSGDEVSVRSYREALEAAAALLAAEGVDQYILEEMDLAYCLTGSSLQPRAVPVWSIRLNGRDLILNAGELIPPEGWKP